MNIVTRAISTSTVPDSRPREGKRVEKGVWNFGDVRKLRKNLMPESSRHLFQQIWDSRTTGAVLVVWFGFLIGMSLAEEIASTNITTSDLQKTATQVEQYINEHLFDPDRFMYSYVDFRTGKPFDEEFAVRSSLRAELEGNVRSSRGKPWSIHHYANSDPVTYWSYEDTILTAGCYMEALVLKYEVTGDSKALEQAFAIWNTYKQVYYASQVYGVGTFLRPYGGRVGGFEGMRRWMEPLGTDQAICLLTGQYALWKHADGKEKTELADIIIKTLSWYEQQDFRYLYYKSLIHTWEPGRHAGGYYLPAIAFAAKVTGEQKWQKLLQEKLPLAQGSGSDLMGTFKWGSDLVMLADLLGPDFEKAFPQALRASGYEAALEYLATFTLPEMTAHAPDWWDLGSDARMRPGQEGYLFLCGLASLGHPGAAEKAVSVLGACKKVPEDFPVLLSNKSEELPEAGYLQLQARGVGTSLVLWYRNYWILRKATMAHNR